MSAREKAEFRAYFPIEDLDRARIVECDPLPIPTPPFSEAVGRLGFVFPDVTLVPAITFDSVIASKERMVPSMLFHELVHVVQFRLLGVRMFSRLYARGFLQGGRYEAIPLECCAFDLEQRYSVGLGAFRVDREVREWIDGNRF